MHPPVPANVRLIYAATIMPELSGAIATAERSIDLLQFQVSPRTSTAHAAYVALLAALAAAPGRGVACRLILARPTPRTPQAGAADATADQLRAAGWSVRYSPGSRLLHAKTWLFDHRSAIVGSHNVTEAGLMANHELSVAVQSEAFAAHLSDLFEHLWARSTEALDRRAA